MNSKENMVVFRYTNTNAKMYPNALFITTMTKQRICISNRVKHCDWLFIELETFFKNYYCYF